MRTILVSACLLGLNTRYDGQTKTNKQVLEFLQQRQLTPIPVCPEQLAGFGTPRSACEFSQGDGVAALSGNGTLRNREGRDVSQQFISGAHQTLLIAQHSGCRFALFKERSPSCGVNSIYRCGELTAGQGVTAALLKQQGVAIYSEEDLDRLSQQLEN